MTFVLDERELWGALIRALFEDVPAGGGYRGDLPALRDSVVGMLLAEQDEPGVRALGILGVTSLAAMRRDTERARQQGMTFQHELVLERLVGAVDRRRLAWTAQDAERLAPLVDRRNEKSWTYFPYTPTAIRLLVTACESSGVPASLVDRLDELRGGVERMDSQMLPAEQRGRLANRLRLLVAGARGRHSFDLDVLLTDADRWARGAKEALATINPTEELATLLEHLPKSGLRASQPWKKECVALIAGATQSEMCIRALLDGLLGLERDVFPGGYPEVRDLVDATNVAVARGALWACALGNWSWSVTLLRDVGVHCATAKGGGATPRSEKLANASIAALGDMSGDDAITALASIRSRTKARTLRTQSDRVLHRAAQRAGITEAELLERAVPSLGLDEEGVREQQLGDHTARIRLTDRGLKLDFVDAAGRTLKTAPPSVRNDRRDELAALRTEVKDALKTFVAERSRLEDLFAEPRSWDLETWTSRYLRHPLTGFFARHLIWTFEQHAVTTSLLPLSPTEFVDRTGTTVEPPPGVTSVRLWHPAEASVDEVEAWRDVMVDRALRQPFKQAFREIYLVTPAELTTETYSNRYAAHILRYRQAYALMRACRWDASSLGGWESGSEGQATRAFPAAGLRATFYYQLIEDEQFDQVTANICSTDQVRFQPLDQPGAAVPIASVPPLVFSEAMRDVDLFVGVTSIAADPNWIDSGPETPFAGYWHGQSFGMLTASAEVRHETLQRLVPRTRIADRCTLTERFLVVRGDVRTYKIHIGSGNVLMEPNDQYLCIVPQRGPGHRDGLFLPFEEDGGLLSTILSKAFLLADDRAITDPTIMSQITR